jgi:hypothetical protein
MKALASWSPAPCLNVTAVEREGSRWLVTTRPSPKIRREPGIKKFQNLYRHQRERRIACSRVF